MPVNCHHCGEPIHSRDSLAVGGRTLRPMHTHCYATYAAWQPWHRRPGWPANRWSSLLRFNGILLAGVLALSVLFAEAMQGRWSELMMGLAAVNGWLLVARAVSFVSIERHLPDTVAGGGEAVTAVTAAPQTRGDRQP